jgi:hypothetical protein
MHSDLRKLSIFPAMVVIALALFGCDTMSHMWTGTTAMLSGSQEVPPVSTQATGTSTIKIASDKTVTGGVSTSGITPTAAHIHMGAPGRNGPVIVPLTKTSDSTFAVPSGAKLTDDQYDAFKAGNLYVNVHSAANKGGEIRAQLQP